MIYMNNNLTSNPKNFFFSIQVCGWMFLCSFSFNFLLLSFSRLKSGSTEKHSIALLSSLEGNRWNKNKQKKREKGGG